jgi:hypothetical protein
MQNPVDSPESLSPLECYQLFRNRIEHEDNLIIQRLSWLMASQSFLFTAYAIVTNALATSPGKNVDSFINHLLALVKIIPIVALLNSLLIAASIIAALIAINQLRCGYKKQGATLGILRLQTSRVPRVLGLAAPVILPLLFFAVWLYLLMQ